MRVLLTAGPTREPIDPVRFLSNRSTGAMGIALAEELLRRGHEVSLVCGPIGFSAPQEAETVFVETTREMLDAALARLEGADAMICAAAVCDFRPEVESRSKLKRGEVSSLRLVENPDVAAEIGRRKGARPLAVFALESEEGEGRAREKMERKNADFCVLNAPDAVGAETAHFLLLRRGGENRDLGTLAKKDLAKTLLDAMGL